MNRAERRALGISKTVASSIEQAERKRTVNTYSVDVAPVVHGRWIESPRLYYGAKQYECSLCYSDTFWNKHSITEKYPCCPNCGCKMDLEG